VTLVFAGFLGHLNLSLFTFDHCGQKPTPLVGDAGAAGAACSAGHKTVLLSQKVLVAHKAMTYTDLLPPV